MGKGRQAVPIKTRRLKDGLGLAAFAHPAKSTIFRAKRE